MSAIACNAKSLYEYSSDATDELDLVPGDLLQVLRGHAGPGNPVRSAKSRPFWPENVRSRRPLHLLQSMHFNDLSLDTILK